MNYFSDPCPDSQFSPLVRSGLLGTSRVPQGSATCMSWGGAHYRTFDRKHFHFQGSCTYLLASSTDGTWVVYISTVCSLRGNCSKVIFSFISAILLNNYFTRTMVIITGDLPGFQRKTEQFHCDVQMFISKPCEFE